jgi:hypothetical protein
VLLYFILIELTLSDLCVAIIYKWKYGPTYLNHVLLYLYMVSEDLLKNYFLPFSTK